MGTPSDSGERPFLHGMFFAKDGSLRPPVRILFFITLGVFLVLLCGALTQPSLPLTASRAWILFYLLADAALLGETWLFLAGLERRSFRAFGLWFYRGWGKELLLGIALGAGLQVVVTASLVLVRAATFEGFSSGGSGALRGIAAAGILFILAGSSEEIIFRGYLFQGMLRGQGQVAAVAVFSILFGVGHLANPSATPLSTVNTILSGVLLGVAYLRTRGLWMPIGLHWAWNFFQGPVLSFPVSGLQIGPSLCKISLSGSMWLSGGAYGPEGSIPLTVASLAAIVWLARTRRLAPSPGMQKVLQ